MRFRVCHDAAPANRDLIRPQLRHIEAILRGARFQRRQSQHLRSYDLDVLAGQRLHRLAVSVGRDSKLGARIRHTNGQHVQSGRVREAVGNVIVRRPD